jgi:hypothetical protein
MRRVSITTLVLETTLAAVLVSCATWQEGPTPCDTTAHNHRIKVADVVSCKDPHVSKEKKNDLKWFSAAGTNLSIVFEPPTPFPELTCGQPNECRSGTIAPGAAYGPHKYHAWLDGKEIDPNVIIDK